MMYFNYFSGICDEQYATFVKIHIYYINVIRQIYNIGTNQHAFIYI